jgi:hypothetical protein
MKIPKGASIRLDTDSDPVEVHINAAITSKTQANELIAAIRQLSHALEGERRTRRPKVVASSVV